MRFAILIAVFALAACQPSAVAPPPAPVVLTVLSEAAHGQAANTGLFERYALSGPARAFTLEELADLESVQITTAYPSTEPQQTWAGPRLSAVLSASGAPGAGARLTALDGYTVELTADWIATHEPILANSADGAGLTLGGLGPIMVIWPETHPGPDSEENASDWIWSVFAIEAVQG
jgi:hypothetical protein